jgi:metal-sulfur cluster biosynthetic enzyme
MDEQKNAHIEQNTSTISDIELNSDIVNIQLIYIYIDSDKHFCANFCGSNLTHPWGHFLGKNFSINFCLTADL